MQKAAARYSRFLFRQALSPVLLLAENKAGMKYAFIKLNGIKKVNNLSLDIVHIWLYNSA